MLCLNSLFSEGSLPLTVPVSAHRILTIAESPAVLERVGAAVQQGGGIPVGVAGITRLTNAAGQPLPFRFVVCVCDGNLKSLQPLLSRLHEKTQLVCITDTPTLPVMTLLMTQSRLNHFFSLDDMGLDTLTITVRKFITGDLFGVEKYLPSETPVHLSRLSEYQGRSAAIESIVAFAEKSGARRQLRSAIGQVCEELLMNALYDAPIDANGVPLFAEVNLKDRVHQSSPRPVSIRYAATDAWFAVSVRDRFGRLDKGTVLRYLDKCIHNKDPIDRKIYGAGLGMYLIANAATKLVLNIAPGVATEVVCTFSFKNARSSLRCFSVFVYPENGKSPGHGR